VNGEAGCTVCSQARLLKAVFPVTKGYELKRYECASCGSNLWLVTESPDHPRLSSKAEDPAEVRGSRPSKRP
jgi:hypothetical protein